MTISKKNFSNMDPATIPVDSEYVKCNFARPAPDLSGADPVGVRLFPGDDTPRTFRECNLTNCEVPPGSTVIECNTSIVELELPDFDETITVDGVEVSRRTFTKSRIHGRYNPSTGSYDYEPAPIEVPER